MWRGFNNRSALETSFRVPGQTASFSFQLNAPFGRLVGPWAGRERCLLPPLSGCNLGDRRVHGRGRGGDTSEMWSRHEHPPPVPQERRECLCLSPGWAPAEGRTPREWLGSRAGGGEGRGAWTASPLRCGRVWLLRPQAPLPRPAWSDVRVDLTTRSSEPATRRRAHGTLAKRFAWPHDTRGRRRCMQTGKLRLRRIE